MGPSAAKGKVTSCTCCCEQQSAGSEGTWAAWSSVSGLVLLVIDGCLRVDSYYAHVRRALCMHHKAACAGQ